MAMEEEDLLVNYTWHDLNPRTIFITDFENLRICCLEDDDLKVFRFSSRAAQTTVNTFNMEEYPLKTSIMKMLRKGFVNSATRRETRNYVQFKRKFDKMSLFLFHRTLVSAGDYFRMLRSVNVTVRFVFSHDERMAAIQVAETLLGNVSELMEINIMEKCSSITSAGIDVIMCQAYSLLRKLICEHICLVLITSSKRIDLKEHLQRAADFLMSDLVESVEDSFGGFADDLMDIYRVLAIFYIIRAEIQFSVALVERM